MLDRRDYPAAEKHFTRALELSPNNRRYLIALALTREHHLSDLAQHVGRERLLGHSKQADALLAEARALDPKSVLIAEHETQSQTIGSSESWLSQHPTYAGAITLTPTPASKDFHLHTDLQEVIRNVATSYGIRPVFDSSVAHKSIRFDLEGAHYEQAMPILLQMGRLFAVPLDATSILIAQDTAENRLRLERQMQETIYVPGMTAEQMSDLGNLIRNVFDVKQATVENNLGSIVLRAPEASITAINRTLDDLLDGGSEVLIELKMYSVSTTHDLVTGLQLPSQIGAYNVASAAQSLVTANQSIVNQAIAQGLIPSNSSILQIAEYLIGSGVVTSTLLSNTLGIFGGGITTTGVYATGGATLNFGLNSSDSRALDDIQLRVGDRQPAEFRVGTHYPITTSTYTTGTTASSSSLAGITINGVSAASLLGQSGSSQTIPQIQYEDLGITLKTTPYITKTGSINLKLDMKIEALSGSSLNNIPILSNTQFVSDVTVGDGETALLTSNMSGSQAAAITGVPGLSELPGFQSASDTTTQKDTSQLVLLLTPHIVRRRSNLLAGPRIAFAQPVAAN